jgi:WD40 repeat protein
MSYRDRDHTIKTEHSQQTFSAHPRANFMRRMLLTALMLAGLAASASAADAITPADPQLGRAADFNLDVFPVLASKCLACHSRTVHEGDLVLEDVTSITKGGATGPALVAGKPDESLIYKLCARLDEPTMPPQPNKAAAMPLTPRELGLLRQWIQEGAKPGEQNPAASTLAWQSISPEVKTIYAMALSPEHRFIAFGRTNQLIVGDLYSHKEAARLVDPALRAVQNPQGQPLYPEGASHLDFVQSLAFSPNGDWLASGSYREIKLWQRQRDVKLIQQPTGGQVAAVAVNEDGTRLAFAIGNTVRIASAITGQPGATAPTLPAAVTGVAFAGDSLITACDDGSLSVFNPEGQAIATWPTGSPVKSVACSAASKRVVTGHADGKLRVWTLPEAAPTEPPKPVAEYGNHGGAIIFIQLRPGTSEVVTGCEDGNLRRVNLDNGAVEFTGNSGGRNSSVAISPDGTIMLAAGGPANLAKLWKRDGAAIADLKTDPALEAKAQQAADDTTVAKSQANLADEATKQAEKDVTEREDSLKKANEAKQKAEQGVADPMKKVEEAQAKLKAAQEALAQKPDDGGLKNAVTETEKALKKETEALQKAKDAIVSADRAILLSQQSVESGKKNLEARKLQLTAAQEVAKKSEETSNAVRQTASQSLRPMNAVAISPDSLTCATAGDDGLIHLWDAATGRWLESLHGHSAPVRSLAYTASGALLSAADDQSFILWDVKPQWKLAAVLGGKPENSVDVSASPMFDRVLTLAFSPDGKLLASGGGDPSRSGELLIWDVAARGVSKTIADLHSDTILDLDFSRDGKRLATSGADKFVKVVDLETGKLVRGYEGHTSQVLGVAWKADGSSLASCSADNSIKIWNVETGEQRRTISNYSKQVTAISYIGVTDNIVSCSGDTNAKFHNAGNGGNYRTFGGSKDYLYAVSATPDETRVIAAGEEGIVRIWDGKNAQFLFSFDPPAPEAESKTASR